MDFPPEMGGGGDPTERSKEKKKKRKKEEGTSIEEKGGMPYLPGGRGKRAQFRKGKKRGRRRVQFFSGGMRGKGREGRIAVSL